MYASILILLLGGDPVYDVTVKKSPVATAPVNVEQFACKIYLKSGMGSGVITEKGVVTCFHVVNNEPSIEVVCGGERAKATVVVVDRDYDLALLLVPWIEKHEAAKLASESPIKGAILTSAGRCKDGTITVESHTVEGNDKKDIRFTNCSNTGRSGAGMFNRDGELVGIIHGNSVDKEPYTGLARDINHVVRLGSQYTPGKTVAAAKPPAGMVPGPCPGGFCPIQQPQQQFFWNRRSK